MSTVVSKNVQIGADGTASNNFTAYQPATPDGTLRIGNGNSGSVTDAITLTSAGNVGIGTSSPSSYASTTLEISGSSASSDLKMTNTTTGTGDAAGFDLELNGSDINYVNRTASGNQKFWTNSTERMRIDSAGNVGIGTSSFSQKLSVSSSATDVTAINLVNTSSGGGNYNIGAVGSAGWVGGSAGSLVIRDSLVGATRVVLDSSGNLGLGNTPSATSAAGYTAFELGTSAGTGLTGNNGDLYVSENAYVSGGAWKYAASSIASAQYNLGGGVHRWFNAAAGTANNNITWTQAMTLTAAGNLGIGTTSPADVKLSIFSGGAGTAGQLKLGYDNSNMFQIGRLDPVGTGSGNFQIKPNGGTSVFDITSSGSVGIGTSSPSVKLQVNGASNASALRLNETTSNRNTYLGFIDTSGNFGIDVNDGGYLRFAVNGAERARIDTSGNMTLTANLTAANNISIHGAGYGFVTRSSNGASGSNNGFIRFDGTHTPSGTIYTGPSINAIKASANYSTSLTFKTTNDVGTNNEAARINNNGDLLVGTTSTLGSAKVTIKTPDGSGSQIPLTLAVGLVSDGFGGIGFRNPNGVQGSVAINSTSVTYNTSSDYRLKEDWVAVADAATRVNALKPINFAWKVNGTRVDGFLAHELAEVVPEAVTGEKDAVDDDGKPVYQGIDQSKLVPLLTAALQEALAEINSLKARLDAANL
jgi:hypothetical protein